MIAKFNVISLLPANNLLPNSVLVPGEDEYTKMDLEYITPNVTLFPSELFLPGTKISACMFIGNTPINRVYLGNRLIYPELNRSELISSGFTSAFGISFFEYLQAPTIVETPTSGFTGAMGTGFLEG